jgi:hypothetical protein
MYLNVDEIESALDALAAAYPDETEVVTPPHATHRGRRPRLLRVGRRRSDSTGGFLFWAACMRGSGFRRTR